MKCAYCQSDIEKGTGMMYVRKTGAIKYYCSNRCYKFDVVQRKKPIAKQIREAEKLQKKKQEKK